ncbi:MAG: 6-carboxytetrahydropterin synthase [bacterium]|nr:6-carboxytetrahydropterin synthase [bacterium]
MKIFRVAKTFEVEYGHRLAKHPEKCRYPHGHRLKIEIVVRGSQLDENDMVCDYKALKTVVADLVDRLDHSMALNSADPQLEALRAVGDRVLLFEDRDPTTEVLAQWLYDGIAARLGTVGDEVATVTGAKYSIPAGVELERVRVWETSSSWAECVAAE